MNELIDHRQLLSTFKPDVIVLANGSYPTAETPKAFLNTAPLLVCCDGALNKILPSDRKPDIVIGDGDSLSEKLKEEYATRLIIVNEQDTNDLSKAIRYCIAKEYKRIVLLGTSGLREDHAIGNFALLINYGLSLEAVVAVSDHGTFYPIHKKTHFKVFPGQQVSLFAFDSKPIFSEGLKYPLNGLILSELWQGTLNESEGERFTVDPSGGNMIVYIANEIKKSKEVSLDD